MQTSSLYLFSTNIHILAHEEFGNMNKRIHARLLKHLPTNNEKNVRGNKELTRE